MPKPTSSDTEMKSPGTWENSDDGSTNEEDLSPAEAAGPSQLTRMTEESSEEDDFPKVKVSYLWPLSPAGACAR